MGSILAIFTTVFLAELGDKTQLAAVLFASDKQHNPYVVFFAASGALCLSTAIAVFLGNLAGQYLEKFPLKLIAGLGFVAIGMWSVYDHFRTVS